LSWSSSSSSLRGSPEWSLYMSCLFFSYILSWPRDLLLINWALFVFLSFLLLSSRSVLFRHVGPDSHP
jgi:hypothetical protein